MLGTYFGSRPSATPEEVADFYVGFSRSEPFGLSDRHGREAPLAGGTERLAIERLS